MYYQQGSSYYNNPLYESPGGYYNNPMSLAEREARRTLRLRQSQERREQRWKSRQQARDDRDRRTWNRLKEQSQAALFVFRNKAQQELWKEEITGQLSDGMWENSWRGMHFHDWAFWSGIPTVVRPGEATHVEGRPSDIKVFSSYGKLIEYVGDRMLALVQKYYPTATLKDLRGMLREIGSAVRPARLPRERRNKYRPLSR